MDVYRRHASLAVVWADPDLSPVSTGTDCEVWFALRPQPRDRKRYWEALNARELGENVVEVCAVPALAEDLAFGDRVSVIASAEGALVATELIERSRYATFRILLGRGRSAVEWAPFVEDLARLGCIVDAYTEGLIAVACTDDLLELTRTTLADYESTFPGLVWEESRTPNRGA